MSLRTGLAASIGFKLESAYGVPVVVDTFLPFVSESLSMTVDRVESSAILAGRETLDSSQWSPGGIHVAGQVQLELPNKSTGSLFRAMLGAAASPFTPSDLAGTSLTVQVGRPGVNGTIQPFEYPGVKVGKWEIACKEGEIVQLGLDLVARAEYRCRQVTDGVLDSTTTITSATAHFTPADIGILVAGTGITAGTTIASVESDTSATLSATATATSSDTTLTFGRALAAVSYASGLRPFVFTSGSLTVGGTAVRVKSAKLAGDNKLPDDRRFLGSPLADEPYSTERREFTGEFEAEFTDRALYDLYVRGVESALVLSFVSGAQSVVATCNVRFDGTTPTVAGPGVVPITVPFVVVGDGSDADGLSIAVA